MQYHHEGYRAGDPTIRPPAPDAHVPGSPIPDEVDVLIVGTGPAGVVLGAQLAAFPGIRTRLVERRDGPLERGQADGVACRTVEMLQAFGLATTMLDEAYWVNESVFWAPDEHEPSRITRTGRVRDTEDGLSEMPHLIVNQARLQELLLGRMRRSPTRLEPDYGVEFVTLETGSGSHPVRVTLRQDGREFDVRARYVVGCDGARSAVRSAIGRELHGDVANHAWGVVDVLATTDFPDVRFKALIRSAHAGGILLIPREGGHLIRLYVDLGEVTDREAMRRTTSEQVLAAARQVLQPYSFDVREIVWSSVYEVGQRIADGFDNARPDDASGEPHVFIAGDACHTHSAKAGQGMNVSMQDAFNLGWKLASVLEGRSDPDLLRTYSAERRTIAHELIDFDRHWSATIAARVFDPEHPELGGLTPAQLEATFLESGRYTAGVATRYGPSILTGDGAHQAVATGFPIGMRFHSAPVTRIGDARELQLGHVHEADGRWRLYLFADADGARFASALDHLRDVTIPRFTPSTADLDSVLDVRGVLPGDHRHYETVTLHEVLRPLTGALRLRDYEKAFAAGTGPDEVYRRRGIDASQGALVLVRPDQYVAQVLPLSRVGDLDAFLGGVLLDAS